MNYRPRKRRRMLPNGMWIEEDAIPRVVMTDAEREEINRRMHSERELREAFIRRSQGKENEG